MTQDWASFSFTSEAGDPIVTGYEAALKSSQTEFARRWERMYVLQIARFVGGLLRDLSYAGIHSQRETIPLFGDWFAIFDNQDAYFRSRSRWTIYRGR
jgi:hypothetical protein